MDTAEPVVRGPLEDADRSRSPLRVRALGGLVVVVVSVVVVLVVVLATSVSGGRPRSTVRVAVARPLTAMTRHGVGSTTTGSGGGLSPLAPSGASPLRVVEIGDSLGIDLGDQLQAQLDATGLVHTTMASVGDSGLANASFLDWPAQLASLVATDHPQIVVVFIGANDDQGLYVGATPAVPGSAAWTSAYAQRVDDIVREATTAGARVVWVGMPPMANPDLEAAMQRENAIYARETQGVAGAQYVSSDPVLGNAAGLYQATGDDGSGQPVALRTPDGVHLTPAGARLLARAVIEAVDERWHLSLMVPT